MRMPADQLAVQMVKHIGNREVSFVRRHLRIEQNLQQQIAQFFGQMRKVAALNRVENLVGLFQRVFANGVERLFAVPGASARSPQPRHDGDRLLKQRRCPLRISNNWALRCRCWCLRTMCVSRAVHRNQCNPAVRPAVRMLRCNNQTPAKRSALPLLGHNFTAW